MIKFFTSHLDYIPDLDYLRHQSHNLSFFFFTLIFFSHIVDLRSHTLRFSLFTYTSVWCSRLTI